MMPQAKCSGAEIGVEIWLTLCHTVAHSLVIACDSQSALGYMYVCMCECALTRMCI